MRRSIFVNGEVVADVFGVDQAEIEARAKAYQHSRELLSQLKGLVETIECVDHRLIEDLNPAIGEFVWSAKKVIKKVEGM
jgi:hypothetical protein